MATITADDVLPLQHSVPEGTTITINLPDDFHHHVRDGEKTRYILKHATQRFGRCMFMPNLVPPVTTAEKAMEYYNHIQSSLPEDQKDFTPLMSLYLTDKTTPQDILDAHATGHVVAGKYYPSGATTNSHFGVTNAKHIYPAMRTMAEVGMMLCIHSEVTHGDIFEREPIFLEEVLKSILADMPSTLKIVLEHISTKESVDFVMNEAPDNVKASITCHHLIYNRNALLVGGIKPHFYCLPILKSEKDRIALVKAATSGSPKFFLGSDSAPHYTQLKEAACGCAGVYTAHAAVEYYAEVFEKMGVLEEHFEAFCSKNGAEHYGLPVAPTGKKLTLMKKPWTIPKTYPLGNDMTVTPLGAGETIDWCIVKVE